MAKDLTIRGPKTNQPIPRPKNPAKVHELEKERRKNFPTSYKDVSPYVNPRAIREKTFEEFMAEIFLLTPQPKKKSEQSPKPKPKPNPNRDPYGEDPAVTRVRLKKKQQQSEMVDYARISSGADAATERAAAAKRAKLEKQRSDADAARHAARTTGIPFSDAKGSGFIRNGVKHYST